MTKPFSWREYKGLHEYALDKSEVSRVSKLFLYIVFIQVLYVAITTAMFFYKNPCISQDVIGWSYTECTEDERQNLGL